jgi:hypothetical protein
MPAGIIRPVEGPLDDVHSALLQPAIDFTIYLPPRPVDRNPP